MRVRTLDLLASPLACLVALAVAGSAAYVVRSGDTLSAIAQRAGVSVSQLAAANGIADPNRIYAGQTLQIPSADGLTLDRAAAAFPRIQERRALVPIFAKWAKANGLDLDLLLAVTWMESGWQNGTVSPVGAVGIGQLMPDTSRFVQDLLIGKGPLDPHDPEDNIRMSARYLKWLVNRYDGDQAKAVAAYYQGPGAVESGRMYGETVTYVDSVMALRKLFAG